MIKFADDCKYWRVYITFASGAESSDWELWSNKRQIKGDKYNVLRMGSDSICHICRIRYSGPERSFAVWVLKNAVRSAYMRPKRTSLTTWYSNKQMRDLSHSPLFNPGVEGKTLQDVWKMDKNQHPAINQHSGWDRLLETTEDWHLLDVWKPHQNSQHK